MCVKIKLESKYIENNLEGVYGDKLNSLYYNKHYSTGIYIELKVRNNFISNKF